MKIDIILLASGSGSRFGSNKLLYKIKGKPVFGYALEKAVSLRKELPDVIGNIIVVSIYEEIRKICQNYENITYVGNPDSAKGISVSIQRGIKNAQGEAFMFMVCDNPYLSPETLKNLVTGFVFSGKSLGCIVSPEGKTTNPCIFSRKWEGELMALEGDKGGKSVINRHKPEVFFYLSQNMADFYDIDTRPPFRFINEKGHIISIVGGGGKTSLMYRLGEMFGKRGFKVIISTTTHIYRPKSGLAETKAKLIDIWKENNTAVVGKPVVGGKLAYSDKLKEFIPMADAVIIEADGSKGLPCKTPAGHEPAILPESDIVIGVAGIDALGKPLKQVCFRPNETAALLGTDENHIMTENDIAQILSSERGTMKNLGDRKYIAVINKCDNENLKTKGRQIKQLLDKKRICSYVCSLRENFYEG